ncbi:MAG: transglutaminase domain-containing protein [Verrucomicrobia bacterium]|nr:transglutaminase domain-containing protein [Verrucomicrobiota bacterium]
MNVLGRVAGLAFLLVGGVWLPACVGQRSEPQESSPRGGNKAMLDFYRTQSAWTDAGKFEGMYASIPDDVASIVEAVQGVLIHGGLVWLYELEPSEAQQGGFSIRKTDELLARIKALDDAGLDVPRPREKRLVVNCRQFAVLTCSILRAKGIPARARAGYALYTWRDGKYENHWICEYWNKDEVRWIQVDAQIDAKQREFFRIDFDTLDMPKGRFVVAADGWRLFRDGKVPPENFGVGGGDGWNAMGWGMAMANVTCDMLALNKVELLPWDTPPFAEKTEDEMSPEDMALIEEAAELTMDIDTRWPEMRQFYERRAAFHMPEGFGGKEEAGAQD